MDNSLRPPSSDTSDGTSSPSYPSSTWLDVSARTDNSAGKRPAVSSAAEACVCKSMGESDSPSLVTSPTVSSLSLARDAS